jgi:DNA-binding response OmpR family regulator
MHALIIEDEPLIAMLIEDHLRAVGYASIEFAVTEAEAVESARRRCPDVVTADVTLAQGCGIAAVKAICDGRQIPVVFITASGWAVRERMRDAVVIPKPLLARDLARALPAPALPA